MRMPRCCVPNCRRKHSSTHYFPKDPKRCADWVKFIRQVVPDFVLAPWYSICGAHFEMDCFNYNYEIEAKLGCKSQRRNLTEDAVPTILNPFGEDKKIVPAVIPASSPSFFAVVIPNSSELHADTSEETTKDEDSKKSPAKEETTKSIDSKQSPVEEKAPKSTDSKKSPLKENAPKSTDSKKSPVKENTPKSTDSKNSSVKKKTPKSTDSNKLLVKEKKPLPIKPAKYTLVSEPASNYPNFNFLSNLQGYEVIPLGQATFVTSNDMVQPRLALSGNSASLAPTSEGSVAATPTTNPDLPPTTSAPVKQLTLATMSEKNLSKNPYTQIIPAPSASPGCKKEYTLSEIKRMSRERLLQIYSVRVHVESQYYALRCRIGDDCPFVISCPLEHECKNLMYAHLRRHFHLFVMQAVQGTDPAAMNASNGTLKGKKQVKNSEPPNFEVENLVASVRKLPISKQKADELCRRIETLGTLIYGRKNKQQPNDTLQKAFMQLKETIALKVKEVEEAQQKVKQLKIQQETAKNNLASPVKYLLPLSRRKTIIYPKQSVVPTDLILSPLGRFCKHSQIAEEKHEADEKLPVITQIRGSVRWDEGGSSEKKTNQFSSSGSLNFCSYKTTLPLSYNSVPLSVANSMIANAKCLPKVTGIQTDAKDHEEHADDVHTETTSPFVSIPQPRSDLECDEMPEVLDESGCEVQMYVELPYEELPADDESMLVTNGDIGNLDSDHLILPTEDKEMKVPPCAKKELFLNALGLKKVEALKTFAPVSDPTSVPKLRTRMQKRNALRERICLKRYSNLTPKQLRVKLQPINLETIRKTGSETALRSKKSGFYGVPNGLKKRGIFGVKFYMLWRAALLKKRAIELIRFKNLLSLKYRWNISKKSRKRLLTELASRKRTREQELTGKTFEKFYSENKGELMELPMDGMLEVYKEEQMMIEELEEERESKRKRKLQKKQRKIEAEMVEKELAKMETQRRKWENKDRTSLKQLVPSNKKVYQREGTVLPVRKLFRSPVNFKKQYPYKSFGKVHPKPSLAEGKYMNIKREPMSDDDDVSFEGAFRHNDRSLYSSDDDYEPDNKSRKLSVSSLLFRKRKLISHPESLFRNRDTRPLDKDRTAALARINTPDHDSTDSEINEENKAEQLDDTSDLLDSDSNDETPSARSTVMKAQRLQEDKKKAIRCMMKLRWSISRTKDGKDQEGEDISDKDLTCELCSRKATDVEALYNHYKIHAECRPFQCTICHKSFARKTSLKYHKMVHENAIRFRCVYCNKGFRHPSHYKEHLNKHTGATPFRCQECSCEFKTSNSLRRHMASIHGMKVRICVSDHMPGNVPTAHSTSKLVPTIEDMFPLPKLNKDSPNAFASKSPPLPDSPINKIPSLPSTISRKNKVSRAFLAGGQDSS